ncbi:M56 family metallopeptidase [Paenibacillus sp. GSMTC-2017]|uniref:M56 family metallopeptidase n=1 Tax=Paenibacillus sp. GSMTC-2017 TaxID=2794350 RepID=UPI0018D81FCE|nr:M56 family metallopeptidase [Paenibacillus sp. GSMTC-2017]MBH5316389.1 M56 family metallopeptidase [Paenibacillus sp. GSMTC-2017]
MSLLEMSISASCIILAVVLFRSLLLHKVPKMTFIVLWGVVLFRLLVPVSVQSQFSVFTAVNDIDKIYTVKESITQTLQKQPILNDGTVTMPLITDGLVNQNVFEESTSSISPFVMVWFVGFAICALSFIIPHLKSRSNYKMSLPIENDFIRKWQKSNRLWRKVQIRQLDTILTPLTYGVFQPVVLLPKHIDYTDEEQLNLILMHEYVHIKRFDTLKKWLLAASLCVHWFNPLVWIMYILANRDIELSCDETVIRTTGDSKKSTYALALVHLEEKKSGMFQIVSHFSKNSIEERVISIMKMKKFSIAGTILAFGLVAGTVTVFATSASDKSVVTNSNASHVVNNKSEAKLGDFRGDFRNGIWGMSTNEYKKTEDTIPYGHGNNTNSLGKSENTLSYNGKINSLEAVFGTYFIDNKLAEATYTIVEQHSNATEYIKDFKDLKTSLIEKYGTPITDDINWKDDMYKDDPSNWGLALKAGHLIYTVEWETETTKIFLKLHGGDDQSFLGIFYADKKHLNSNRDTNGQSYWE